MNKIYTNKVKDLICKYKTKKIKRRMSKANVKIKCNTTVDVGVTDDCGACDKMEIIEKSEHNWTKLSQWIQCMCVVTFDLNLGQALEYVYPPEFMPSEQEISNICYMAFPDSNSGCMGDTKFHMRLRAMSGSALLRAPTSTLWAYNKVCAPALHVDQSHLWGFVYFRQKRDANLPRGYFQKSLIIITRLPYFNLFYDLIGQLAPKYFSEGTGVLETACAQIEQHWPALQAGEKLNLPMFDCNYQILIPKSTGSRKANAINTSSESEMQQRDHSNNANDKLVMVTKIIPSVNEIELFQSLAFIVDHLYTLWELVLTAEPIVVVGTSPADCSHMVQTLLALIAPLEYCAEARPYFTIHDSEFKEFTQEATSNAAPPSIIIGVTNPFFIKLFKDWPHMLRLVDNQLNMQQQQYFQKNLRNSSSVTSFSGAASGSGNSPSTFKSLTQSGGNSNATPSLTTVVATTATTSIMGGDSAQPGLHTKYKPFLKKDKALIKKIMLGIKTKRPVHVQTTLIRRHLLELTYSFMIPLERYMASLMPLQKDISPFKSAPNANSFKQDDFLATLDMSGPHLTSTLKGDWKGLYQRFFVSPNFRCWYETRNRELQLTLQDLQLQALSEANLEVWARGKQEVEIIDMILKLKHKLDIYTNNLYVEDLNFGANTRDPIRDSIDFMKRLLPNDLQDIVNI